MSENEQGIRGGIELSFMSTTTNRTVAEFYVSGHGFVSIVLEMQMGMVDRGASLSELSQYPHEQEICFGPSALRGFVYSCRIE